MFISRNRKYLLTLQHYIGELGLVKVGRIVLVAQCHSVEEALESIQLHEPDVIFLQHSLTPQGNEGFKIAAKIKHRTLYSISATPDIIKEYKARGIKNIKHVLPTDIESIAAVLKG